MITLSKNPFIILDKAAMLAVRAHQGQTRKDGVTPYITHPLRVANLVSTHGGSHLEVLCAYWHDILEDCPPIWHQRLIHEMTTEYGFGETAAGNVMRVLAALCKPTVGNRHDRNEAFITQVVNAGMSAVLVKLCDRIDNVLDSDGMGAPFAKTYVVEETGRLIEKMGPYALRFHCEGALLTLCEARDEVMSRNEWTEES